MPSISARAPLNAKVDFLIRIRDWNGDEMQIDPSQVSWVGNFDLQTTVSGSAIGTSNVGAVSCSAVVLQSDVQMRGELRYGTAVVATIILYAAATTGIVADGAVLSNGGYNIPIGSEPAIGFVPVQSRQDVTPLTLFQPGHGWSVYTSGGASPFSNLNETAGAQKYGSQHAWAGTAGGASAGFAGIQRLGMTPINTTGKTLRVTFKIVNRANLQEFGIFVGTSSLANYCRIYAHSNQAQWLYREGEIVTIDYPLGTRTFAAAADYAVTGSPTMNAITDIRLRVQDGQSGPNMGSVELHIYEVSLVDTRAAGKICIMFDDEDESVYAIAYPILKAAGILGTNYIIANKVGTAGKMTKGHLDELHIDGWSTCVHSYDDAVHDARTVTLNASVVKADLQRCKEWVNANGYRGANHYAYPGGDFDTGTVSSVDEARELFRTARGINTRQSETLPVSLPHRLRTIYVTSTTSAQLVKDRLDCVMNDSKGLALVVFHRLVPGAPAINTEYQTSNFQSIVDHIIAQGYVQHCTTMHNLELDGLI